MFEQNSDSFYIIINIDIIMVVLFQLHPASVFPLLIFVFRYLNAGLSIGYAWAYLDMLEEYDNNGFLYDIADDQRFWQTVFLSNRSYTALPEGGRRVIPFNEPHPENAIPYIALDYHQSLFQSLLGIRAPHFDFDDYAETGRIVFKESGGRPCAFHQHGPKENGVPHHLNEIFSKLDEMEGNRN